MAIKAVRNGQRATFTEQVWKEMPPKKYGWVPESEVPEEVQALLDEQTGSNKSTTGIVLTSEMLAANPGLSFIGVSEGDVFDVTINGNSIGDKLKAWIDRVQPEEVKEPATENTTEPKKEPETVSKPAANAGNTDTQKEPAKQEATGPVLDPKTGKAPKAAKKA